MDSITPLMSPIFSEESISTFDVVNRKPTDFVDSDNSVIETHKYRPIIICIDGLISSGKSPLLKGLKKKGFKTYPEPLHKWKAQLEKFYENPKKEFLNTQSLILNSQTRLKGKILENISTPSTLSKASIKDIDSRSFNAGRAG